jgi:hypothetical protein
MGLGLSLMMEFRKTNDEGSRERTYSRVFEVIETVAKKPSK